MNRNPSSGDARRILCQLLSLALLSASGAFSAPLRAAVLGTDDRNDSAAFLTEAQQSRFEGVGRIECSNAHRPGITSVATGWLIDSADLVMTAAHTFFHPDRRGVRSSVLDPRNCTFARYSANGSILERSRISYGVSPWANASVRGDSSNDFAVLKLERPIQAKNVPTLGASGRMNARANLVAFQSGVTEDRRIRVTHGEARRFPVLQAAEGLEGTRVSKPSRLFISSASSSPGSSGGLYYDEATNSILGMHLGFACDAAAKLPAYDPQRCFNYGLRFDREVSAFVAIASAPEPPTAALIGTVRPTDLAMLEIPSKLPAMR